MTTYCIDFTPAALNVYSNLRYKSGNVGDMRKIGPFTSNRIHLKQILQYSAVAV